MNFPQIWKSPEAVKGELETAGFRDAYAEIVEVNWHIPEPKEFVTTFINGLKHVFVKIFNDLTDEQMAHCRDEWVRLVEENGNICHGQAVLGVGKK